MCSDAVRACSNRALVSGPSQYHGDTWADYRQAKYFNDAAKVKLDLSRT